MRKLVFTGLILLVGCVSLTALTHDINNRGAEAEAQFKMGKLSKAATLKCAKSASVNIELARRQRLWPGWLPSGSADKILKEVEEDCNGRSTVSNLDASVEGGHRPQDLGTDAGQGSQEGPGRSR